MKKSSESKRHIKFDHEKISQAIFRAAIALMEKETSEPEYSFEERLFEKFLDKIAADFKVDVTNDCSKGGNINIVNHVNLECNYIERLEYAEAKSKLILKNTSKEKIIGIIKHILNSALVAAITYVIEKVLEKLIGHSKEGFDPLLNT